MVSQTTMSNGVPAKPRDDTDDAARPRDHTDDAAKPRSMTFNLSHLVRDLVTLAELQTELFAADVRQSKHRLVWPLGLLLGGAVLLLACFPVALIGLAIWLGGAGLHPAAAYVAAAGIGAAVTALLLTVGWKLLVRALRTFHHSTDEFVLNLRSIKSMLKADRD